MAFVKDISVRIFEIHYTCTLSETGHEFTLW